MQPNAREIDFLLCLIKVYVLTVILELSAFPVLTIIAVAHSN